MRSLDLLLAALLVALSWAMPLRSQTGTFVPALPIPAGGTMVYDPDRQVTVVFEAGAASIWAWDGSRFRQQLGVTHAVGTGCIWDPARRRILATNGNTWDGANWSTLASPTGWTLGAMAYDLARQRLVRLADGGDVAEWDGVQWHRIHPPASPGTGALVYDPTRSACVLATGSPLSLWTWDGSQWNLLDANGPVGAFDLTFDPGHGRLVAYGITSAPTASATFEFAANGWTPIATPASFSLGWRLGYDGIGLLRLGAAELPEGIWRLEGTVWRQLLPAQPRPRTNAALASWPTRRGVLVFGGNVGGVTLDDTWILGDTWKRQQPAHSPSPRRQASIAWSPADLAFVLFGGIDQQFTVLTDTWLWTGTDWVQQSPTRSPPHALQLVTDPAGGVLGLRGFATGTSNTQWQWNGTTWSSRKSHGAPFAGALVAAGHDPRRNLVTTAVETQLWEWNGAIWRQRGNLPMQRPQHVVFRPDTQRMAFIDPNRTAWPEWDGATWTTVTLANQVLPTQPMFVADFRRNHLLSFQHPAAWTGWNGASALLTATPAGADRSGYGCAIGASPGLLTAGRPNPGNADFAIAGQAFAANAPCVLTFGFTQQGTHLGAGCVAWIAQPPAVHFLLADAAGSMRFPLPIPNDASLRSVALRSQLAVFDPPRSALGSITVSDSLRFTIGD